MQARRRHCFESIWRRGKNVTVCLWATSSSQIMGLSPQAFSPRENLWESPVGYRRWGYIAHLRNEQAWANLWLRKQVGQKSPLSLLDKGRGIYLNKKNSIYPKMVSVSLTQGCFVPETMKKKKILKCRQCIFFAF